VKIGVMVLEGPYQHKAADSAYHFVKAALARGHEMYDELAGQGIDVVACTACAKFRGMKRDLTAENIRLSGLGSLAEASTPVDTARRHSHLTPK
jgi:tRNA 2-thiouridine synthesizing protein D